LWIFISFLGTTHLFQDWLKLKFTTTRGSFWGYLSDQLLHILLISLVFITNLKNLPPPQANGNIFITIYNNNAIIAYLTAIIIAGHNGIYMIRDLKTTFFNKKHLYTPFEKWYGILERTFIVTAIFADKLFFLLIPLVCLIRPLAFHWTKGKFHVTSEFLSSKDMILSWVLAILTGIVLNITMQNFIY